MQSKVTVHLDGAQVLVTLGIWAAIILVVCVAVAIWIRKH